MSKPGPVPAPTNLRLLRGNPGGRKISRKEPKPKGVASMPSWLTADAKLEWKRVSPILKALKLLTPADQTALVAYCEAVASLKWATKKLDDEPRIIVSQSGYPMPHPAVAMQRQATETIRKFAQEFGFTPSARTRIEVPDDPGDKDPFEEFLSGKHGKKKK